mmetsp:Transcript_10362/g.31225  ORF Transcript_10362/g.31225 Transcript_10362/m.31225 type:complete len:201 (-) Transcript_10362:594-1196(-)
MDACATHGCMQHSALSRPGSAKQLQEDEEYDHRHPEYAPRDGPNDLKRLVGGRLSDHFPVGAHDQAGVGHLVPAARLGDDVEHVALVSDDGIDRCLALPVHAVGCGHYAVVPVSVVFDPTSSVHDLVWPEKHCRVGPRVRLQQHRGVHPIFVRCGACGDVVRLIPRDLHLQFAQLPRRDLAVGPRSWECASVGKDCQRVR